MADVIRSGGEGGVAGVSGPAEFLLPRSPGVGAGGSLALQTQRDVKTSLSDHLSALVDEPTSRRAVGPAIFTRIKVAKDLGNLAVHSHKPVREFDALIVTKKLFHVLF